MTDWSSCRILGFRLSNPLTADFCVEALEEAIGRHGVPDIVNTKQGSQFIGVDFIEALRRRNTAISMDGRGCWQDNVFIERSWKMLKHEEAYLGAYHTASEARASIARYVESCNVHWPHSRLQWCVPDEAYFSLQSIKAPA